MVPSKVALNFRLNVVASEALPCRLHAPGGIVVALEILALPFWAHSKPGQGLRAKPPGAGSRISQGPTRGKVRNQAEIG